MRTPRLGDTVLVAVPNAKELGTSTVHPAIVTNIHVTAEMHTNPKSIVIDAFVMFPGTAFSMQNISRSHDVGWYYEGE